MRCRVGFGVAERDDTRRVAGLGRGGRGRDGGGGQARFGEIGGVREAGGLAADDTDARASAPTRDQLLDPAVVEAGATRSDDLRRTPRRSRPRGQGRHPASVQRRRCRSRRLVLPGENATSAPACTVLPCPNRLPSMAPRPGLTATVSLAVTDDDTATRVPVGRRRRTRHPAASSPSPRRPRSRR